jgi:hypothetical protein
MTEAEANKAASAANYATVYGQAAPPHEISHRPVRQIRLGRRRTTPQAGECRDGILAQMAAGRILKIP